MKYALLVAALLSWCAPYAVHAQSSPQRVEKGNRITEGIPEIPGELGDRLLRYQGIRRADFDGWLANGQGAIISTRFGDTYQAHWVDHPGGARQQLTFYSDPVGSVTVNPSRNGFAFVKDTGGAEFFQIYYFDLDTRAIQLLTDGMSRNEGPIWSNHGDRVAFDTTRRNGNDSDVHIVGLDGKPSKAVVERKGTWDVLDWSPDDARLLVRHYLSDEESYPYAVDIASGAMTALGDAGHKTAYNEMKFSRDGKGIYYISNETGEFAELHYRDVATGAMRSLTANIPWDIESFTLSKNGQYLAFAANQDGIDVLHLIELKSGREVALPALQSGQVDSMAFSADSKRLGFTFMSAITPGDAYAIDLTNPALVRWTSSEVGGLDARRFVEPSLEHYPTFDQAAGQPRRIPAFYYRPQGKGPFPVIIHIHGGPEDQARPLFNAQMAFWVNELGVAVIMPNVRGSTGYGKTYLGLDNGFKREDAVKDIGALLDWIATRPELDASRVGVDGGSYGGFMVMSTLTHYSQRLRAGIELVGQSNFVTFLEHTEGYRRDLRRAEYGDERDPKMRAFLERIAPTTNAKNIGAPLFVAVGANDPRVPPTEGLQIASAVRANGNDVWFLEFKDEGHGFGKKQNRNYFEAASVLFWQKYLLAEKKHK
ncbi:S9 family peptidase [Dyella tabacisoli]|uniref:S9 family peptidase n=1 Tax=Dyella tabacisoli TaxID=2282381 RepID=A0A369UNV9_9GAMM|nr:prolyl oligopeptidase family serine peptidase [Dyella tabacisoli]RDD80009.1 S9 family peptidase [Dyella tabacisoli]